MSSGKGFYGRLFVSLVLCFFLALALTKVSVFAADSEFSSEEIEAVADESSKGNSEKTDDSELSSQESLTSMSLATTSTSSGAGAGVGQSTASINVSQFAGAASARIPILVPPGRNGISPNLNMIYNSTGKNGVIGIGWSLEVGTIQRQTKFGIDYSGEEFIFANSEASFDIVRRHDWGTYYYGAKIEGGFLKFYLDPSSDGWVVTGKDGLTYYYGSRPLTPDRKTPWESSSGDWTGLKTATATT